jgi:predicted MFS family arabinose efflux permease
MTIETLGRRGRLIGTVLPFAAGYFLSYWIRTINGPLSDGLAREFQLGPADLGLLTSLYFLTFAAFQVPAGLLIDRFGPRRVQAAMLIVAAMGGFVFAGATGQSMLMLGRALIGLGCSSALVTGVKMLALSLPPERRAMGNCGLVMCGGLGAIASAAPIGLVIEPAQWRWLFVSFGAMSLLVSPAVWLCTPDDTAMGQPALAAEMARGLQHVVRDARFWRVAPLSALVVGSAFAIHGLWAARWLVDVAHSSPAAISTVLLTMGASLTVGALSFGVLASLLRRRGVSTTRFFGAACVVFLLAELVLATGTRVPPIVSLGVFAVFGGITVLSFTIIGEMFPTELTGRANAALNVLHLGAAFVIQAGIGIVVAQWPVLADGHRPALAYTTAFMALVAVQAAALAWFADGARQPAGGASGVSPLRRGKVAGPG